MKHCRTLGPLPAPSPRGRHGRPGMAARRGVTLIELLVAVSIATVLLTIGVSGMTRLVAENRRVADVNTLMGNLNFARAEAIYRMANVVVCPIDPANLPSGTSDPCVSSGSVPANWGLGYIIFVEATGERLRIQDGTQAVRIQTDKDRQRFIYYSDGRATNGTFTICDRRDTASSNSTRGKDMVAPRAVTVSPVGRVRVSDLARDGDIDCSKAEADYGSD